MLSGTKSVKKTPIKYNGNFTPSPIKFKASRQQNKQFGRQNKNNQKIDLKLRTKQKMAVITSLEQIYSRLNFNDFDAFPINNIEEARKNIENLYYYLQEQPICPKHQQLLNLYCENDKQVVCVACIHKTDKQHKNHKIKSIDDVEKSLDYESVRSEEKGKALSHQLEQIKHEMEMLQRQVSQCYKAISADTMSIINQAITDLQKIKMELENYLGVSYRRTTAILSSYANCIDKMAALIDMNIQKSSIMSKLSKYLLLKELNKQTGLMDSLVGKFNENKDIIDQWLQSNRQFEKIVIKKKSNTSFKQDVYVVTQF